MKYLGIDVHSKASVWCLLDEHGEVAGSGKTPTQFDDLQQLVTGLRKADELVVGQEVGTQAYLVRDAVSSAGVPILSFNAAHLRVIAASRKKTDRRDAYWIAKSLQTGMTPHPVYLPDGLLRHVRELLTRRRIIQRDRNRWVYRGRALLRARGLSARVGKVHFSKLANQLLEHPDGVDTEALEGLGL